MKGIKSLLYFVILLCGHAKSFIPPFGKWGEPYKYIEIDAKNIYAIHEDIKINMNITSMSFLSENHLQIKLSNIFLEKIPSVSISKFNIFELHKFINFYYKLNKYDLLLDLIIDNDKIKINYWRIGNETNKQSFFLSKLFLK